MHHCFPPPLKRRRRFSFCRRSPGHHHVFAVRLGLQPFHDTQLDFGLGLTVELHLVRQQANLPG